MFVFFPVQTYLIKYFTSEELSDFDNSGKVLKYEESPQNRGEDEKFEINYDEFEGSGLYYIRMKATNSRKSSDLSNVIEVFIPDEQITTTPKTDDPDGEKTKLGRTSPKKIGLIAGLIVGLIVLLVIISIAVFFLVVKPKRKEERKQKDKQKDNPIYESSSKVENNTLNPISFISADTLIKHHNEKTKAKLENKEPPIFVEVDFEDRREEGIKGSSSRNESDGTNNMKQFGNSTEIASNHQSLPPKSPKRTTYV